MSGFLNKPKILRGAFVEYGLSVPPLSVVFQFNPVQLTRNRSLTYEAPSSAQTSLRDFHKQFDNLTDLQRQQQVTIREENIGFEIRLDATDKLDEGDPVAGRFGIAPQLSTLELMVHPKDESLLGRTLGGFSFPRKPNPPLILFIWGRNRVLPVNIEYLNITEILYSTDLNPIRATAAVNLTVIEGNSVPYRYSKSMKEAMSVLSSTNTTDNTTVIIPD